MTFELDHLFICTNIDAPEADRLISFGLNEGTSNIHAGQGTANRRFFFHNCMLELLWVHSPAEARSEVTHPTYLWERWRDSRNEQLHKQSKKICPFGVCLRPTTHPPDTLPFSAWSYRPAYLPNSLSISVGTNATVLTEPMLFYLPFGKRQDSYPDDRREPLKHRSGFTEITRVTLISPDANDPSPELKAIVNNGLIELRSGETYRLELGFDGEKQGKQEDFQPELPLTLHW